MTTENCKSFLDQVLDLIRAEDCETTTPPMKELIKPKLRLFDIDDNPKFFSPIRPFPIQQKITKIKQIEKPILNTITKCKCMKSKCQKSYCECFAAGKACNMDCNCQGCNNTICSQSIKKVQTGGCNCKKTGCLKKYCECYLKKQRCTFLCNCIDCCNQEDSESEKENEQLQQQSIDCGQTITNQIIKQ
ncbi:unnamed protein product (macronuclear) [Paramecium tetraurelia]|uniref:CRC domain-containing protein n=1 Tax=Paramecium tetraurelia TaxID=5888 RepID=A0C4A8_PARTE|nr:uncharacterized protein GSPATT00035105001 [Paramecium tetraurelia]CAK65625.1 unnamed protein product [Paramecium tetraurelia]|eukprot:XP_001433022.1 hypothetical protein (macronuclear) [Paramecium tetraurelia strain d4-2]